MEKYFLPALLLTTGLETIVLFFSLKLLVKERSYPFGQVLFVGFLASFATLPYLWFVLPMYVKSKHEEWMGELGVTLVEALIFNRVLELDGKKALMLSLFCNLVSYTVGGFIMTKL